MKIIDTFLSPWRSDENLFGLQKNYSIFILCQDDAGNFFTLEGILPLYPFHGNGCCLFGRDKPDFFGGEEGCSKMDLWRETGKQEARGLIQRYSGEEGP